MHLISLVHARKAETSNSHLKDTNITNRTQENLCKNYEFQSVSHLNNKIR